MMGESPTFAPSTLTVPQTLDQTLRCAPLDAVEGGAVGAAGSGARSRARRRTAVVDGTRGSGTDGGFPDVGSTSPPTAGDAESVGARSSAIVLDGAGAVSRRVARVRSATTAPPSASKAAPMANAFQPRASRSARRDGGLDGSPGARVGRSKMSEGAAPVGSPRASSRSRSAGSKVGGTTRRTQAPTANGGAMARSRVAATSTIRWRSS